MFDFVAAQCPMLTRCVTRRAHRYVRCATRWSRCTLHSVRVRLHFYCSAAQYVVPHRAACHYILVIGRVRGYILSRKLLHVGLVIRSVSGIRYPTCCRTYFMRVVVVLVKQSKCTRLNLSCPMPPSRSTANPNRIRCRLLVIQFTMDYCCNPS